MEKIDKWLFRIGCLLPLAFFGLMFILSFIFFLLAGEP